VWLAFVQRVFVALLQGFRAPFCSLPVRRVRGAELSPLSFSCTFDVACSCDARNGRTTGTVQRGDKLAQSWRQENDSVCTGRRQGMNNFRLDVQRMRAPRAAMILRRITRVCFHLSDCVCGQGCVASVHHRAGFVRVLHTDD
jgi:hypothetical protein